PRGVHHQPVALGGADALGVVADVPRQRRFGGILDEHTGPCVGDAALSVVVAGVVGDDDRARRAVDEHPGALGTPYAVAEDAHLRGLLHDDAVPRRVGHHIALDEHVIGALGPHET